MEDTPNTGETANQKPLENNAPQVNTPPSIDPAEVERLRKAAEQAQMRANQLENQLKKKEEAEEAAKLKQLEEQNEWKSVAEQERAKREALEQEREAEQRANELRKTTKELFKDYPQTVIEIAEETGLGLNDTSEESQAALKEKLDKIAARVSTTGKVAANNPANPTAPVENKEELLTRARFGDREAQTKVISQLPAVQAMRKMAGLE